MKRYFLFLLLIPGVFTGSAQTQTGGGDDSIYCVQLKEVQVKAKWLNDTDRYHYNQMKYYVTTILPYVNAATKLFKEINAETQREDITRKERRKFINSKEDEMRADLEEKIKGLNITQGVLLVKLIARQTDMNIYKMLQEFKNPVTAIKWQAWARLNGMNLDKRYRPEDEPDLENIMEELGYPLPSGYVITKN